MKKHWIVYTSSRQLSPMSFWVHVEADGQPWYEAAAFEPPLPKPVPAKGYPYFYVEYDGFVFEFASLNELDVCIATLSQKNLPPTERETEARSTGPSSHWLNRLPGHVKPWRYREGAVKYLREAKRAFEKEIASS